MAEPRPKQNRIVILLTGALLIYGLITALTQSADDFPPYAYAVFSICLNVLITIVLAILVDKEFRAPPGEMKSLALVVGSLGVVAGIGRFIIRFTSDHAWWSGNYHPIVFN